MSTIERIALLTAQLAILHRHDWPGIAEEIRDKQAELRRLLMET